MLNSVNVKCFRTQLGMLPYLWVALLPLILCVQGYLYGVGGALYLTNTYALLTIVLLYYAISRGVSVRFYYWVGLLVLLLLMISFRGLYLGELPEKDYTLLIRSWLLFLVVYYLFRHHVKKEKKIVYAKRLFFFFWLFVSASILYSKFYNIGLYTYPEFSSGYKFWFPATNELSFLFMTSFVVVYNLSSSVFLKFILSFVTIYVFMTIGTKIFVVFFLVFFALNLLFYVRNKYGATISLSLFMAELLALVVVLVNYDVLAVLLSDVFIQYSDGAEKISSKIQSVGVVSAMLGERDILVNLALTQIGESFSLSDFIFGRSATVHFTEFGIHRGIDSISMVENDILDLLMSYGVFFVLIYIVFIYKVGRFNRLFTFGRFDVCDRVAVTHGVNMIIGGVFSGHVLFFTLPMLLSAVVLGGLYQSDERTLKLS